jgi:hypothetical protein
MHTSWKTLADKTAPAHRLAVAIPLVLAVVALTLREGMDRSPVADLTASSVRVQADPGATYTQDGDDVVLTSGGILVYAPGIATVTTGPWSVKVWGGSVYVSAQGDRPTVAALDVPVIAAGTRGTAVIPSSRQWKAPAKTLPDPATDPAGWLGALRTDPIPASFSAERLGIIDAWRAPADRSEELADAFLRSADSDVLAAAALSAEPGEALAAALRSRGDLRLYALIHPVVRDASWAFLPTRTPVDADTWVAMLALPDVQGESAPTTLTARRWGQALSDAFATASDPDAARSALLPPFEARIADMADAGYPLRALRFAEALRDAVGSDATLTADAASSLLRLRAMTPDSLKEAALDDVSTIDAPRVAVSVATTVEPDPALEQRARDVLAARGGMFTKDSSVRTVAPGAVEVRDVVFGLPSGDRLLRFEYTVDTDTVRAIHNGITQPYAVPYGAYMEWEAAR